MSLLNKHCSGLAECVRPMARWRWGWARRGGIFATFSALINDSARLTMLPGPPTRHYISEKPQPSC